MAQAPHGNGLAANPNQPHGTPLNVTASNAYISLLGPPKGTAEDATKTGETIANGIGLKGVFENITDGMVTTVRHIPSGLVCHDPRIVLTPKVPVTAFDPAQQSGCITPESGVQHNLMVIANGDGVSATEALAALMLRERTLHPMLQAQAPGTASGPGNARATRLSASLTSMAGTPSQYMHLAVATVNGWVVLDETTGTQDQAADCDRIAEAGLNAAIATIHKPGA
jgi:hypothetical protein